MSNFSNQLLIGKINSKFSILDIHFKNWICLLIWKKWKMLKIKNRKEKIIFVRKKKIQKWKKKNLKIHKKKSFWKIRRIRDFFFDMFFIYIYYDYFCSARVFSRSKISKFYSDYENSIHFYVLNQILIEF